MAGDWIKMRIDLQSHPKVVRILSATQSDKFRAIGGLHAVWSVFDTHSEDGFLRGYTPENLDHVIGWQGFSSAMIAVDWLRYVDGIGMEMPEFQEHNGKSAKRRAEDQKRKKIARSSPQSVRNVSAENGTKSGLEKRREENKKTNKVALPRFDEFWIAYPRKEAKAAAEKAWAKIPPATVDLILSDLARRAWPEPQFIPLPASYLNGRRWEDDQHTPKAASKEWAV
jgi:hypothetical protein